MSAHEFGTLSGPVVYGGSEAAGEALAAMMHTVSDPGPVIATDGLGRHWTASYVYGVDSQRYKVCALPRNPPEETP